MVEPHIFCGPEFVLESRAGHSQPFPLDTLLQLQTDLYNLLTLAVRRKIYAAYVGDEDNECGGGSSSAVPPPPNRLLFVEVQPIPVDEMDTMEEEEERGEEKETAVRLLLLVTDSRVAAELFLISLKNPFIALSHHMRLRNRYRSNGAKIRTSPGEILRKKEALRLHMNLDDDLWTTLQETLTPEWLRDFEVQQQRQHGDGRTAAPVREVHRHEQRVESLLRYCDQHVHYVGVMDDTGKASPFLLAMGMFYQLGLTYRDALVHMVRHPRRTIRALALFIARYTAAPEELEAFFAPSLTDEVVIACTEDLQVTSSMRQLCEDLLLRDEVCEAWPPTYHPHWIEHTVRPMMQRVETDFRRREELRLSRERNGGAGKTATTKEGMSKGEGGVVVQGSGDGVGVFGFRNLKELQAYVREKQRVLVPQRVLSMLERSHRDGGDDDDEDRDDDDDDDFLIKIDVGDTDKDAGGGGVRPNSSQPARKQQRHPTSKQKRPRDTTATSDNTRALVVTGAYRAVLRLLGRTEPFDKRGEHYLFF